MKEILNMLLQTEFFPKPAMIVHSFSPTRRWFEDFAAFADALGAAVSPERPAAMARPGGRPLLLGWADGRPAA